MKDMPKFILESTWDFGVKQPAFLHASVAATWCLPAFGKTPCFSARLITTLLSSHIFFAFYGVLRLGSPYTGF